MRNNLLSTDYHQSYLGQLRRLIGKQKIFAITARAIIQDENGRILLVRRSDNGAWVMPAGSIELEESILDCLKREVLEETGLVVFSAYPIALYSEPRFSFVTSYGDPYQMFSVVFVVDEWSGDLQTQTDETINARFFAIDNLPDIPDLYRETLADLQSYRENGQFILK
jgi:ADP-ribose pyrophosphatase YjhB (NUDIX family)